MKTLIFFIVVLFTFAPTKANSIDSIRIIGLQHDIGDGFSRMTLFNFINRLKYEKPEYNQDDTISEKVDKILYAYIDTTIIEWSDIENLMAPIKTLKKFRKLKFNSSFCLMEAHYSRTLDELFWFPTSQIGYYLMFMIFSDNDIGYIWIGREHLERGRYILRLSDDYKRLLSKYTHVYDADFRKKVEPE